MMTLIIWSYAHVSNTEMGLYCGLVDSKMTDIEDHFHTCPNQQYQPVQYDTHTN